MKEPMITIRCKGREDTKVHTVSYPDETMRAPSFEGQLNAVLLRESARTPFNGSGAMFFVAKGGAWESYNPSKATERRMEMHDLEIKCIRAENEMGAKGQLFRHRKSKGTYVYRGIALREEDLAILVRYSPIDYPRVEFTRPFTEFAVKFEIYNTTVPGDA